MVLDKGGHTFFFPPPPSFFFLLVLTNKQADPNEPVNLNQKIPKKNSVLVGV
jgi:hypothetical protein